MAAIKKVIPVLDRILVKRAETMMTTKGGIVLSEKAAEKMLRGTVMAVGPGARNSQNGAFIPMGVKVGDVVLIPEYGGTRVKMGDKKDDFMLYRESDILAKLELSEEQGQNQETKEQDALRN